MAEDNTREVNTDTEILDLEDDIEDTDTESDEDEDVISQDEIPQDNEDTDNQEDSDSSPESDEEDTEESDVEPDEDENTDSDELSQQNSSRGQLPGETRKEYALRLETQRLRTELREANQKNLLKDVEPPESQFPNERLEKLKEYYTDEQIAIMEQAIDTLAAKNGYVKQADTYQQLANDTLTAFIDDNPEYLPKYDKGDKRWNRFQEILKSDYNLRGKTPKQLRQTFEKINRDVIDELGEVQIKNNKNTRKAQEVKLRTASHGGSTKSSVVKEKKPSNVPQGVKSFFKGFDDDDLVDD